jgi:Kef-type K+ transport system membrane component KefB
MRISSILKFFITCLLLELAVMPGILFASENGGVHHDPIAPVILVVTGVLVFAFIGRFIARKLGQPGVLGELLIGVAVGNFAYFFGYDFIIILRESTALFDIVDQTLSGTSLEKAAFNVLDEDKARTLIAVFESPYKVILLQIANTIDIFSRYGVIFLLFLVGFETSTEEMRKAGVRSIRVALVGVILPFILGLTIVRFLMPEISLTVGLFIAATLGATSIGITARVMHDLHHSNTKEAHIILGAAVIDDILGLVILAVVSGIVVTGGLELFSVASNIFMALIFLGGAIWIGPYFLKFIIYLVRNLDLIEAKMFISHTFMMILAWMANLVGLAAIIGAFTAGLILHDAYFYRWGHYKDHQYSIKDLIMPLEVILVPIFFVLMGVQVKLETFFDLRVVTLAAGLLVAAILGKVVCGIVAGKGINRWAVGIGMMPRGEVGLIYASIGKTLGVVSDSLFSAIVLMVIITTLITPPFLKFALERKTKIVNAT